MFVEWMNEWALSLFHLFWTKLIHVGAPLFPLSLFLLFVLSLSLSLSTHSPFPSPTPSLSPYFPSFQSTIPLFCFSPSFLPPRVPTALPKFLSPKLLQPQRHLEFLGEMSQPRSSWPLSSPAGLCLGQLHGVLGKSLSPHTSVSWLWDIIISLTPKCQV